MFFVRVIRGCYFPLCHRKRVMNRTTDFRRYCALTLLVCGTPFFVAAVAAHPVPSFSYDRVIQVKLTAASVEVAYQLNLDEITIYRDVKHLLTKTNGPSCASRSISQGCRPAVGRPLGVGAKRPAADV